MSPLGAGDPGRQVRHYRTPGRREGNNCQDVKHSGQSKDTDTQGLGAALLLTQHSKAEKEHSGFSAHPPAVHGGGRKSEQNVLQTNPCYSTVPLEPYGIEDFLFPRQAKPNQDHAGHSSCISAPTQASTQAAAIPKPDSPAQLQLLLKMRLLGIKGRGRASTVGARSSGDKAGGYF